MDKKFRINHIDIQNYKGLDELCFDFPTPLLGEEPDVCVMGSQNGVGKTSLLECCAILVLASRGCLSQGKTSFNVRGSGHTSPVRGNAKKSVISGVIDEDGKEFRLSVEITGNGDIKITPSAKNTRSTYAQHGLEDVIGLDPNPIETDRLLFLHSYRKIIEENPDFSTIIRSNDERERRQHSPFVHPRDLQSRFKREIIKNLMSLAGMFDDKDVQPDPDADRMLNSLLSTYANVTLGKLRPYDDSTMDIMVKTKSPTDYVFPLNSLSSGQKEIVSTLFLIWLLTKGRPHVVLIDEPELHLNLQWHKSLIRNILSLAPYNQYIMATHSEQIMGSVEARSRFILG